MSVSGKGKSKAHVPFLGVEPDSSWAVSEDWRSDAAADEGSELFGGLYDWLPKFCLFSFAFASSLSNAAASHRSTVDANSLQNWQQEENRHEDDDTCSDTSITMCQELQVSTDKVILAGQDLKKNELYYIMHKNHDYHRLVMHI